MDIKNTGQFKTACIKWKRKQPANRATKQQLMTQFDDDYDIFDAKNNTLHPAGITNNDDYRVLYNQHRLILMQSMTN